MSSKMTCLLRTTRARPLALLVLLPAFAPSGPLLSGCAQDCTEMGCQDQASLTIRTPDHTWPPGTYVVNVGIGGTSRLCRFELPATLPPLGSVGQGECDGDLWGSITAGAICHEERHDDRVSEVCTPIPDQWIMTVTLPGAPSELRIRVTRDDVELADEVWHVQYSKHRPNGPDCSPVCQMAEREVILQ
jgi:hypothetical protein